MSNISETADLTATQGVDLRSLDKSKGSPFLQNVIASNGDLCTRPGFGLVREYGTSLNAGRHLGNTGMPAFDAFMALGLGLGACIGATAIRTPWGADQILAVHPVRGLTGNFITTVAGSGIDWLAGQRAKALAGVAVVVHDLHTGRHVEFVLHEQDALQADLSVVLPHYSTRFNAVGPLGEDHGRWYAPTRLPEWAVFANPAVTDGSVVIAIDGCGQWTYRPVDTSMPVLRQNDSLDRANLLLLAGESCALSPMAMMEGRGVLESPDFVYLRGQELGSVDALAVFNDTAVYGVGNVLRFSEQTLPPAINADSFFILPTVDTVRCLAPVRGMLFVATDRQCWALQPVIGKYGFLTAQLTDLSATIGCIHNRAYVAGDDGVFFVSDAGVYLYRGGTDLVHLSVEIDRLWADPGSMQMPLTDFYVRSGITGLTGPQLPARIDVPAQMRTARLSWSQHHETLYCVCDDITLCWTANFGWTFWYFASHAGSVGEVQGVQNIENPIIVPVQGDLYLIGGPDVTNATDPVNDGIDASDHSCYLLKLGRGGAVDRSMAATPEMPDVWTCTLGGYIDVGNTARVVINGTNYTWAAVAGDTLDTIATSLAAVVNAGTGDPSYYAQASGNALVLRNRIVGVTFDTVTSSMLAGTGTFVAVHTLTGAAADVTDATLEDERKVVGGYVVVNQQTGPAFYIGQRIQVPANYITPTGQTLAFESFWFPISLGNCTVSAVTLFSLHFSFDRTRWEPVLRAAGSQEFDFVVPSERMGSVGTPAPGATGYGPGGPDGTHQVQVSPLIGSNEIHIDYNGTGGAWTTAPFLNLGPVGPHPLLVLGFKYIGDTQASGQQSSWGLDPVTLAIPSVDGSVSGLYSWQDGRSLDESATLAAKQQPVDWVVKTLQARAKGLQVQVRGVYLEVQHLGKGTDAVAPAWQYGPLNTATSTDLRDYSGQAIDFTSIPKGNTEQNNIDARRRLMPVNATNPSLKTFNNVAKWGSTADSSKGNMLIDDPGVDTVATTDGSQGERVSVMVHGTMNAPGEQVRLGKVEVALRQGGGLRKRWH